MPLYPKAKNLLRNLLAPRRRDREVEAELESYIELLAESRIAAGADPEEARRQVRIELGSRADVRESIRERRFGYAFDSLRQDVHYGLRALARNPAFTLTTVLTLALGIGANTAVFSVVDSVLLKAPPFPDPERLVTLVHPDGTPYTSNPPEFFDFRNRQTTLEQLAVYRVGGGNLAGPAEAVRVEAALVSRELFPILGIRPALGRTFTAEEDSPGRNRVIVLSHRLWQRLGGSEQILGSDMTLSETAYTVVGVMPPGFAFPNPAIDLWAPMGLNPAQTSGRGSHNLLTVGRLRPGATLEEGSAEFRSISTALHGQYPRSYPEQFRAGWVVHLSRLHQADVRDARTPLLTLVAAVAMVLLITCANLANMQLMRGVVRGRELALRIAVGATRGRLVRQLVTESLLAALLGGLLGLQLALLVLGGFVSLAPDGTPALADARIDVRVVGVSLLAALGCGVLFSLLPALRSIRGAVRQSLSEAGRHAAGAGSHRLRGLLVVGQVALSLLLLVGATLLMRSFYNLLATDPGFSTENVLTARLNLNARSYSGDADRTELIHRLTQRIRALPGVTETGLINFLPLGGIDDSGALMSEGMAPNMPEYPVAHGILNASYRIVTPGYHRTLQIPLLQGRYFEDSDDAAAQLVAIVSNRYARTAWPAETDIVGKRIAFLQDGEPGWRTVVGVVGEIRQSDLTTAGRLDAYFPFAQMPRSSFFLAVRTAGDPMETAAPLRAALAAIDPALPLYDVRTLQQRRDQRAANPRFVALVMAAFAVQATLLCAIGVYGVMAYLVSRRTREIGVRVALGALPGEILRMIVARAARLATIGLAVGLPSAWGLMRLIESQLYGVGAADALTYLGVAAIVAAVAVGASWLPAVRATRVDPIQALRLE